MAKKKALSTSYPKRVRDSALRLARSHKSPSQIARELKVPKKLVKTWIAPELDARNRERAKRLERLGHDPAAIAARLDTSLAQTRRWLKSSVRERPAPQTSGRRSGTQTRRCAERMAELDDPILHIANVLQVTPKTIRTWLRVRETERGVSLLPGGRHPVHDRKAILADVHAKNEDGSPRYTRAEIREKYNVSRGFLSHLINGKLDP